MPRKPLYPTAWVNLYLMLEDFGQENPDELIELSGPPLAFDVEVNAFVEADTAKVTADFEGFPFDPRVLRGGTVEIFFAEAEKLVSAQDFWLAKTPEELRSYALFAGVVDVPKTIFDDEHRRFELKCRDYTAYFLDAEIEGDAITYVEGDRKLSLEDLLRKLVAQRETTAQLTVEIRDGIAPIYPADFKRRGTDPKTGARRKRHGERVWDVVQELVLEAGLIAYVELDKLVVREPLTLFAGETSDRLLRWTIGDDVLQIETSRDLGRQHGINVQVTSYDPDDKVTRVAYSPKDAADEPKEEIDAAPVGDGKRRTRKKTTRTTVRPFAVRGITDQEQLQKVADSIREQLRHHELRVEWTGASPFDSQGKPVQRVAYGDPVEFAVAEQLQSILAKSPEEQVRRLLAANYERDQAQKLGTALENLGVPLYVHKARHRFGTRQGQGYTIEIEARSRKSVDLGADRKKAAPKFNVELEVTIGPPEE